MRLLFLCLAFGWIGGGFELRASVAGRERHSDTDKVIEPTPPSATYRDMCVLMGRGGGGACVVIRLLKKYWKFGYNYHINIHCSTLKDPHHLAIISCE